MRAVNTYPATPGERPMSINCHMISWRLLAVGNLKNHVFRFASALDTRSIIRQTEGCEIPIKSLSVI